MSVRTTIVTVLLLGLLANPELVLAQSPTAQTPGSWGVVKSLPTGSELIVKLKSGKSMRGTHVTATDDEIALSDRKKVSSIAKDTVAKVYLIVRRKSRDRDEVIGAAAGGVFGVVLAVGGNEDGSTSALLVVVLALVFAAIGSWVAGAFSPKYKKAVVYEARRCQIIELGLTPDLPI